MPMDPESPILAALYQGNRAEAERLADGATLTIFEAAALTRDDRIGALLDADPALANSWAPDGHTPLGLAAYFGGASTVRLLVERGADVGAAARNPMKVQPLHAAVASRNAEAVALLLERGADVNARQQVGYTPLMGAASAGREDFVDQLLAKGADRTLTSDDGKTAAAIAREHGHEALGDRLSG
jgi:ankyrin repeat protein